MTLTCALQFGSSYLRAVAATCDEMGRYNVLAYEEEPTDGSIRYGAIVNADMAVTHTRSIMMKISNRVRQLGYQGTNAAYVGIGGLPLQRLPRHTALQLASIASHDGFNLTNEHLLLSDVQNVMQRAGIRMAGFITLPCANASLLSEAERKQGVVLIDMGATTTTVSLYKGYSLQHLAVIPLGGDCVTNDMTSFPMADGSRLDRMEAEKVKCELVDVSGDTSALPKPLLSVGDITICRYEEIAANVLNQIRRSGIGTENLSCIVTGGASLQRGLTTLLSRRLGIRQISVRAFDDITFDGSERRPQQASVMAMLKYCTANCEAAVPAPQPLQSTITFDDDPVEEPTPQTTASATEADEPEVATQQEPAQDLNIEVAAEEAKIEPPRRIGLSAILRDLFGGANDGK